MLKVSSSYRRDWPMRLMLHHQSVRFGPNVMNIRQPLLRASRAVETVEQLNANNGPRGWKRGWKGDWSRYYNLMKIPRPKKTVFSYSTWASRGKRITHVKKKVPSPLSFIPTRQLSYANQKIKNKTRRLHQRLFSTEARTNRRQRRKFIKWWTVTSMAIIFAGVASKIRYDRTMKEEQEEGVEDVRPQSWSLYIYSTLPLKTISRLWGQFNSIKLPVWMRSPSFRLYAFCFGVNLDEMAEPDLKTYSNLSDFFYRELKPGARPIGDTDLVSPADGKVLKFGVINDGQIEQVKGMTYSLDSLLGLNTGSLAAPTHSLEFEEQKNNEDVVKRHEEFAQINGISYSVDDIVGGDAPQAHHLNDFEYKDQGDKTLKSTSFAKEMEVASKLVPKTSYLGGSKNLYFTVIYLAPGDYHRFHSPVNWVSTLRRHFIGELFSVAPFFQEKLKGLFVLNERVALLGYWKYGFFSMVPVGATNVGSIVINFDKDLKTNDVYENQMYKQQMDALDDSISTTSSEKRKKLKKNTVYEATYTGASRILGGYPLSKGQEMGGFKLGSTVVLVFEAPSSFKFDLEVGQKVKVGQSLGQLEKSK